MADDRIIRSIVEKCDYLYDDALLSREAIMEKYLTFFASQFDPAGRAVSFAFHTGSLCFDVISVAALMIGCLAYEFSSNDDILSELELGDMVLYRGKRYHWGGVEKISWNHGEPETDVIRLIQDAKGKNGPSTLSIPYNLNKHLVKPYFGDSSKTDGRGIRKDKTNRNDFISYVLGIPLADVPTALDLSVVVVADKNKFIEICKHLKIRYGDNKLVEIADVVPVSYYTGTGTCFQIGKNASKAEAVIKVTNKISTARDLVLDRNSNRVVGLLVMNVESLTNNSAELNDLLRRKTLKFAYVVVPYSSSICELAMEQYESACMFACTKELLSSSHHEAKSINKLTKELNRQILNIIKREITIVKIDGHWNWDQYRNVKEKLFEIKQTNWSGDNRDNFILSTLALINLFKTAFFSMERLENAISAGLINSTVISPKARIEELMDTVSNTMSMREQYSEIVLMLLDLYYVLYNQSPKEDALLRLLREHSGKRIAIVVPKAYYTELFLNTFHIEFPNVICVTANRFDMHDQYDVVIATGDIVSKRFDAIQCYVAPKIVLLLYEFEEKTFSYRKLKATKSERRLNARIRGLQRDDYAKEVEVKEVFDSETTERALREFSDLDDFVDSMGMLDIRRFATIGGGGEYSNTAEVKYVGVFTTGEQILFSKYYSAVVFDQNKCEIIEKSPEKLLPGDVLVFTKKNDYTSNIVDQIFNQLMRTKKLNTDIQDAAEKAIYWKTVLREYKEINGLTYRAITKKLEKYGSSLQEVTIRLWLMEESHIIGPRDVKTMTMIAKVTKDPYILENPEGFFEACRIVRRYRREILSLIAQAINDKLSNKQPVQGSAFEVVYENIEKLSEMMELENVFELDDVASVSNGMVNRPISASEVLV